MFTWTEEQSSAIGLRECNILVSAAAGSGKTAVLVERIKSLIADELTPARPDRMLVVTFTEAAAAEMRRKIIDAVSSESEKSDSEFPIEQLQRVFTASVGTFHSFALGILKRYYYIIDMEPAFNICDEFRKTLLVNEALDALFEEYFERDGGDSDFLDFLNKYAGAKNENAVREMIADSHAFIQSLPDPFAWLESRTEALSRSTEDFQVGDVFLGLLDEIASDLEAAAIRIERLGDYLEAEGVPSLARKNEADLAQLLDLVQSAKTTLAGARANAERSRRRGAEGVSLCADVGFDALGARIKNFAFARFDCAKSDKDCYEPIREIVNKRRKRAKDRLKKLADKFFSNPLAEMTEEIRYTCAPARKLCEAVRRFDELFSAIKRREGVIDFNDIEHMALRILEDERVCAEYRDKFDHIFIDEYQDNNLIQEELISRIKREDNLFMVGDVKQS
ncbi:MAG: UvrD-helicase domain-containing protein, partial [Clostridiales Family XIII bacterium]|nr:UvrD-helicase domain-containing protein [Clostridiales Family XIII bacterium]